MSSKLRLVMSLFGNV